MYEVEVKVPADHAEMRGRLASLDAERRGTVEQADSYYDHPRRSFAATDEALRIRRQGDHAVLTYKGPKVDADSKTRREHETDIDDPSAAASLLEALGFEPAATVRKTRERYVLDGYRVALDTVDGLGTFVEVEATGEESAIEDLRDGAVALLDRLGLDAATQRRASYLELLADARE